MAAPMVACHTRSRIIEPTEILASGFRFLVKTSSFLSFAEEQFPNDFLPHSFLRSAIYFYFNRFEKKFHVTRTNEVLSTIENVNQPEVPISNVTQNKYFTFGSDVLAFLLDSSCSTQFSIHSFFQSPN